MKVAVTGATGFVGRHVLRTLCGRGLEVVVSSREVAPEMSLPAGVRHVPLDVANPSTDDYDRLGRPDVLLHLAWSGLPNYLSLHHFETELPNQYRFLRSLIQSGLGSLVVTGTCYEYGMSSGELAETLEAVPSNPYGYAKSALRRQLEFLRNCRGFSLTWARLFYTYGEGQPPSSLYTQLMRAIERGDNSFGMSPGEQLRDFLPIEDVANSLVELALRAPDAGVVNICSGRPVSVRAFVEKLLACGKYQLKLDLGKCPYPTHEPLAFWGSNEKLRALIGAPGDVTAS